MAKQREESKLPMFCEFAPAVPTGHSSARKICKFLTELRILGYNEHRQLDVLIMHFIHNNSGNEGKFTCSMSIAEPGLVL